MPKVKRARSRPHRPAPYLGEGFDWKKGIAIAAPILGIAGAAAAAHYGLKGRADAIENKRQHDLLGGGFLNDFVRKGFPNTRKTGGATLTRAEINKLREKGHPVSIPFAGMPEKTRLHELQLGGQIGGGKTWNRVKEVLQVVGPVAGAAALAYGLHKLSQTGAAAQGAAPPVTDAEVYKLQKRYGHVELGRERGSSNIPGTKRGSGARWDKAKEIGKYVLPAAAVAAGAYVAYHKGKKLIPHVVEHINDYERKMRGVPDALWYFQPKERR